MGYRVIAKRNKQGAEYLYAVRSARVGGKPRTVEQIYLGKPEALIALRRQSQEQLEPKSIRTLHFGAVAALWRIAQELDLIGVIDSHCPGRRREVSIGTYLTLAAINRVVAPCSKRGFGEWFESTSLPRLSGVPDGFLSSQHFWDATDLVPEGTPSRVIGELAGRVLAKIGGQERAIAFDCSNFFTWIDSGNQRNKLAQRGYNKAHRHDLRQVGMALATSIESQIPLFHNIYAGNRPDVALFADVWPLLEERLKELGLGQATAVYDGGNVSRKGQKEVDDSGLGYVTSVPPSRYPDLLAQPLEEFTKASHERLQDIGYMRHERKVMGRQRVLVQTYSPTLAKGQLAGTYQHLNKALPKLEAMRQSLRQGRRRKPQDRVTLEHETAAILCAQHLQYLVNITFKKVRQERSSDFEPGLEHWDFEYQLDNSRLQHLQDHLFGRRLWMSNQEQWSSQEIILAARSQSEAEDTFRLLHAERAVAWSPMWHWTDQKIHVHGFYCVLGLLLVRLLQRQALKLGDTREPKALIADLDEVMECLLLYPPAGGGAGRPRAVSKLSDLNDRQHKLLSATGALALAP